MKGLATRVVVVLAASFLFVAACGGSNDEPPPTATPDETIEATSEANEPDSISIPVIDVDAPLTPRQLADDSGLPSPEGPYDVAIYDFGSGRSDLGGAPGQGGNVVLGGQNLALQGCVGADPPCDGVFRSLRQLSGGEALDLAWQGNAYRYQVVAMCVVPTAAFDDSLYTRTAQEQVTLLTGAGAWDNQRGWSHVLVVIAKPAPRTAIEPCPEGTEPVRSLGG